MNEWVCSSVTSNISYQVSKSGVHPFKIAANIIKNRVSCRIMWQILLFFFVFLPICAEKRRKRPPFLLQQHSCHREYSYHLYEASEGFFGEKFDQPDANQGTDSKDWKHE